MRTPESEVADFATNAFVDPSVIRIVDDTVPAASRPGKSTEAGVGDPRHGTPKLRTDESSPVATVATGIGWLGSVSKVAETRPVSNVVALPPVTVGTAARKPLTVK